MLVPKTQLAALEDPAPSGNWGYIGIMKKENGNYIILGVGSIVYWNNVGVVLGLYRDNGKENGNYYNGVMWGLGFRVAHFQVRQGNLSANSGESNGRESGT